MTLGVTVLGWLAERRKERSGVRFSQPPKGTDTGPNVQIFFLFFSFWKSGRPKGADCFFVTRTDCAKEQIRESNNRRRSAVFCCSYLEQPPHERWGESCRQTASFVTSNVQKSIRATFAQK